MTKFIPPFLVFCCIVSTIAINWIFKPVAFLSMLFNIIGIAMIVAGLAMGIWVGTVFKTVQTEIHTFKDPDKFVTHGLFRVSRNPIYLGFAFLLTGIALVYGTLISLLFPIIFILVANFWYIPVEENNMERQFGQKYLDYKSRVRRWL